MYGGVLELQVLAHIYMVQLMAFMRQNDHYTCVFSTEPKQDKIGYLWHHGEKMNAHYDVLESETAPQPCETQATESTHMELDDTNMATESEMQSEQEKSQVQNKPMSIKKRTNKRNKLSLKRTTTQYNQVCGICQIPHTRRRISVLCSCGFYVHLNCLGLKSLQELQVQDPKQYSCKCKHHLTSSLQRSIHAEAHR